MDFLDIYLFDLFFSKTSQNFCDASKKFLESFLL